jgi:hypothetical protein
MSSDARLAQQPDVFVENPRAASYWLAVLGTASYAAAKKEIMPGIEHRLHNGLKNRAENLHQSTRQRERTTHRFKSPGHALRPIFTRIFELPQLHPGRRCLHGHSQIVRPA